jgi:hypothetical protein
MDRIPKPRKQKQKIDKQDYIKLKSSCTERKQSTKWEKIFANYSSEKGLLSEFISNSENSIAKTNQLKMDNRTKWLFPKRRHKKLPTAA